LLQKSFWDGGRKFLEPLIRFYAIRCDYAANATKQLGRTVLLSRAFADFVESDFDLERVGEYPVRGFNDPIELFAYHG
jgi:hypothetical protein